MMTSKQRDKKEGKIWGRYQDLMLVGERGEVIPFQRFKNLAKALIIGLVLSLIVAVVFGFLLAGSQHRYTILKNEMDEARQQLAKLRDERDLLLTQSVIKKKQRGATQSPVDTKKAPEAAPQQKATALKDVSVKASKTLPLAKKAETPKSSVKAAVAFSADVRNIKASYQVERSLLNLSFRIYNTTKPKAPLAGRTVVVFKNLDDPPIKWLVVPRSQLVDGKPTGKKGKAFRINNYRTEKFKAYGQKPPVRYNMATIFVFSSEGELLLSKDHSFKIKAQPAPKPIIPAPKPIPAKSKPPAAPIKPVKPKQELPPKAPQTEANDDATDTGTPIGNSPPQLSAPQSDESPAAPSGAVSPTPQAPVTPAAPATPEMPTEPDASQIPGEQTPQPTTQGEQQ